MALKKPPWLHKNTARNCKIPLRKMRVYLEWNWLEREINENGHCKHICASEKKVNNQLLNIEHKFQVIIE
jgi:hypothetical protein